MRAIKLQLKDVIIDKTNIDIINDAVFRCQQITILLYEFIKGYVLYEYYKDNTKIIEINENFVRTAIKCITYTKTNQGRPQKQTELYKNLNKYYETEYKSLINDEKICITNLTHIMYDYVTTDVVKNYKNNIQMNFIRRVKMFINELLFDMHNKLWKDVLNEEDFKKDKKIFSKEVNIIKNLILGYETDYFDQSLIDGVKSKYTGFINDCKAKIIPTIKKNIAYDLKADPFKFLPKMIHMNNILERMEKKTNNVLCLRRNNTPHSIILDTTCIVELLKTKNVGKAFLEVKEDPQKIWNEFFKHKQIHWNKWNKKGKINKYIFNDMIMTDGYTISIIHIEREKYGVKIKKQENLSEQITDEYLDELEDAEIERIKKLIEDNEYKIIGSDVNKGRLLHMIDEEGNIVKYTAGERRHNMKSKYYKRKLDILRTSIKDDEDKFITSGKSTNYKIFKEYVKGKQKIREKVKKIYEQETFRRYKFYKYINKQKTEHKMLEKIENKYGRKIIIGLGDWGEKSQMKGLAPTMSRGLIKILKRRFKTYLIDEYNTSKMCNKCKIGELEYYEKVKEDERYKKERQCIHGLLCCKNRKCTMICNRDTNAAQNILEIIMTYLKKRTRPEHLKRKKKE